MTFANARQRMVATQIARRGVRDPAVLAAMRAVPREAFVGAGLQDFAYDDRPLPIAEGQTISQPYVVAAMAQAAQLQPNDRVLEVGAGSGYAAAVLSRIVKQVYAIERHAVLTGIAGERCRTLGYDNVILRSGDGSLGWPEESPFDAILVSAGGPEPPEALKQQLKIGGRLVLPVGDTTEQRLLRIRRLGEAEFHEDDLGRVCFVPLIGAEGWHTSPPRGDLSF